MTTKVLFHCIRIRNIVPNLSLIMNSPYSCTEANNKAKHSNHWAYRTTPMQVHNWTQAHEWTSTNHPPWVERVSGWVRDHDLYVTAFNCRLLSWFGRGEERVKKNCRVKSKLQSKVWESSMKSGGSQRWEWQQMTKQAMKQRIGWNSFWSLVSWYFSRGSHSSGLVGL